MPRYIDADALRKKILNTRFAVCYDLPWNRWWIKKSIGVVNKILEIIKEFPSADVEEVKHGYYAGRDDACSNCGKSAPTHSGCDDYLERKDIRYCYFCGAKMNGKESGDG